jgi:hypothetical protein
LADLRNPQKNRAVYLVIYHRTLEVLRLGGNREDTRIWLRHTMSRYDRSGLDDYELENLDSILSRGLDDALGGRPPCPIWGLWGDDEPERA